MTNALITAFRRDGQTPPPYDADLAMGSFLLIYFLLWRAGLFDDLHRQP